MTTGGEASVKLCYGGLGGDLNRKDYVWLVFDACKGVV